MATPWDLREFTIADQSAFGRPVQWNNEIYSSDGLDENGDAVYAIVYEATCPSCGQLILVDYNLSSVRCAECGEGENIDIHNNNLDPFNEFDIEEDLENLNLDDDIEEDFDDSEDIIYNLENLNLEDIEKDEEDKSENTEDISEGSEDEEEDRDAPEDIDELENTPEDASEGPKDEEGDVPEDVDEIEEESGQDEEDDLDLEDLLDIL